MSTEHAERSEIRKRRTDSLWWPPYAVFAFWAAVSVPVVYWWTVHQQAVNPPTCFGIGWGCTPDPGSTVALYLTFIVTPVLVVASLISAVIGLAGCKTRSIRLSLSAGVPPALFLLVFVFG